MRNIISALFFAIGGAVALGGCGGQAAATVAPPAPNASVRLSAADVLTVQSGGGGAGPLVTGNLQPSRRADLRAEVSSVVTAVLKENGAGVRQGELLVRLDDTTIRGALVSAQAFERAAALAAEQAERQLTRLKTLRESGMVSTQALEDAEMRSNGSLSELVSARARVVETRYQLQRTEVRAPFDGIVAERKLSVGDTAPLGKELLKVLDPSSLRFEGLVSADAIATVQPGQKVLFRVHGFAGREFSGTVRLVNPAANPVTRQVEVLINIDSPSPRLAGLYAEGRVVVAAGPALVVPASAIVRDGDRAWAWRVVNGKLQRTEVELGGRDPRNGDFTVAGGLAAGDRLLLHPVGPIRDGQSVKEL